MEFIDLLRQRRSIRRYKRKPIEPEKIELLQEAILLAPSSRGIKPWEFIFTANKEILYKLSLSKEHGAEFVKDAALAVVIIADTAKSDVWIEDCSIAAILLQLQAEALGLGSCWIQIRNRKTKDGADSSDYVCNLFDIKDNYKVLCIISIGYPAESKKPTPYTKLDFSKILNFEV